MTKIGTRYTVTWVPTEKVEALVRKRGGDPDKDGLWDFVEPDECTEVAKICAEFREAIDTAKRLRKGDVWRAPCIFEQIIIGIDENNRTQWSNVAMWHCHSWVNRHSDPDETYDLAA